MGSSQEEGLLHQLSQLDQDADLDDTEAAGPRAALLEKHLLEGEKQLPSPGQGPFFYIGGTNGASIISSYCKNKGWQRIQDSGREDYKLKWCEVKSRDSYCSFREGEQLLYQLPNNRLLTTKIGLLSALRVYSRVLSKINKAALGAQARSGKDAAPALEEPTRTSPGRLRPQRVLKMEEFFPETYRLDISEERKAFFTLFDDTQMWICKPTASNQGKGIFLLRNQEEVTALQAKIQSIEDDPIYRKMPFRAPQARIVQRYIQNPLLLDGKKFDVRSYLLIACTMPYMVFFGHGYARLTLSLYDPCSSNLGGHLTNQGPSVGQDLWVFCGSGLQAPHCPLSSCRRRAPSTCCSRRTRCGAWTTSTGTSTTSSGRPRASPETGSSPPSRSVHSSPTAAWGGQGQDPLGYVGGGGGVSASAGLGKGHVRCPGGARLYWRVCLSEV
ncbi:inactive polyglycylase TTLL10-like isoform X4 [Diceros bicornis minor]|uniref:inactive polyglycylase TTLL10-like isoform X4 n=1 Tax=Diceros bicornis minor TaxID=77932 RepID=UPI0026F2CA04|nr:inactive polyglycylase TTLL10-like isoform X4 [Diceros bicornis minor]